MTYTITDLTDTDESVTVEDRDDIVPAIRPWFPDAPTEVTDTLDELERKLDRNEDTSGLEAYLAIRIRQ